MQINKHRPSGNNDHCRKVEAAIHEAFQRSGYRALRRLICEFDGKVLTLSGRVSTYYEKQIAQEIALSRIEARVCLDNRCEVIASESRNSRVRNISPDSNVIPESVALFN
jgi:hypothetical protein